MKRTSSARRVPRKIGADDDDELNGAGNSVIKGSVVKRPSAFSKTKKRSSLRLSFGPGEPSEPESASTKPKSELADAQSVDITSKFGPLATISAEEKSAIPTDAEIKEKKARRARLAQTYASDEDENWASDVSDEFRTGKNEISLRPKEKYAETRLVQDDEDIAEGFEEFIEDGGISLGRKAEQEATRKRRAEMAELIADAERSSEDSEDSEAERNAAYEAAQTKAGTGKHDQAADDGLKTPPKITPLPDIDEVLERLQIELRKSEQVKEGMLKKLEDLRDEKVRIANRQEYVQTQLKETGERYEKLRQEAGMTALPEADGGKLIVNRGLDSLGATPVARPEVSSSEE